MEGLDPSSVGRIRSFTIVPVTTAAAVARSFGRSPASMSFLRALAQPVPQVWELHEQAEADEANHEVDLLLQEHLEGAQDVEIEEVESFAQELQTMAPFTGKAEEEGKMKAYAMTKPPAMLTSQLSKYVASRTAVFDARQSGSTVVSVTVEGDTQSVLRLPAAHQISHSGGCVLLPLQLPSAFRPGQPGSGVRRVAALQPAAAVRLHRKLPQRPRGGDGVGIIPPVRDSRGYCGDGAVSDLQAARPCGSAVKDREQRVGGSLPKMISNYLQTICK